MMRKNNELVATDKENAEVLNKIFAQVSISSLSPHTSWLDGSQDKDKGSKILLEGIGQYSSQAKLIWKVIEN